MLTLAEAAKNMRGTTHEQAIVMIYAQAHPIFSFLPFQGMSGNSVTYNQEGTPAAPGFRAFNEAFTAAESPLNPVTDRITIGGGSVQVDRAIDKTEPGSSGQQISSRTKGLSHGWGDKVINGDASSNPREFSGLRARLGDDASSSQVIHNGNTANGDPLSLHLLDAAIGEVPGCNALLMSRKMMQRMSQAARNQSVGGNVNYTTDTFGRRVMLWDNIPMLEMDPKDSPYASIGFNEPSPGGGTATSTSIYPVRFGLGYLQGYQNGAIDVISKGQDGNGVWNWWDIEWLATLSLKSPFAAARLMGISDAPVVAGT